MHTAHTRVISLLTLSLLTALTTHVSAQEIDPDRELQAAEQVGGARAADAPAPDAGVGGSVGGSSSHPASPTGGAPNQAGTREMDGPEMASCTCRTLVVQRSNRTGIAVLMLAALGALARAAARRAEPAR